jgi:outer membrane protein assembly factor BamB
MLTRLLTSSLLLLALAAVATTSVSAADWPRYGGDAQLTNDVPAADSGRVDAADADRLHPRWSAALDGAVIASPLYAEGPIVRGERGGVVYAATQGGSVYALSATTGAVLWQRWLGTAPSACDDPQAGVESTYGNVSTGVIDRSRNLLYVIGATGLVYALDLTTGDTAAGWPVEVVSETSGELVWGGLTLAGAELYVPVASYCDAPGFDGLLADGRLVSVNVDSHAVDHTFDVVPGPANMGGIWGFGGASVDPLTGDLWTATGNSSVYDRGCDCILEDSGYGESVVQLDPSLGVVAANRPPGVPGEIVDDDFGSTPLLFQPPGCPPLAAAHSKNGFVYVWRRDSLASGPIWSFRAGADDLANPFIGEPSYSPELNTLFVSDARGYADDGTVTHFSAVESFAVGPGCALPDAPTWTTGEIGAGAKPPPLVVGDLVFVAGGAQPGLFALDAGSGEVLWSASLVGSEDAPPAFGDGQVFAADLSGAITAFGVGNAPIPHCFPPES